MAKSSDSPPVEIEDDYELGLEADVDDETANDKRSVVQTSAFLKAYFIPV